ncbi:MAG: heme-binding protein [Acidobacteria bacterium]|nr:heme-binding protein [Acidobacteriota bacterium]
MLTSGTVAAQAGERPKTCKGLPTQAALKSALLSAVATSSGGLNNNMWATIVNADGIVCAVAFSGSNRREQWLLSRVISEQKANTANGLSLPAGTLKGNDTEIALSTANLNTAVNPGGNFYGLQHSNPVDAVEAYQGNSNRFGRANDPMVGENVGGVNVFGGGLGLYNGAKQRRGGVGVSGDTSCADHVIAWRVRDALGLDNIPGGVASGTDNIIYDLTSIEASPAGAGINTGGFTSPSGFGHPTCGGDADGPGDGDAESLGQALPVTNPIGP